MRSLFFAMAFILLLANVTPYTISVYAQTTKLYMEPQSIIDTALTPCNNITITIKVVDVEDLFGYELEIYYKRDILSAVRAVRPSGHFLEPQIDPANQYVAKWEIRNNFNDTHGRLYLAYTLLAPETGRTGSGTLIEITFHVEGIGSTPITFKETILGNSQAQPIPHEPQNSYFSNAPPPPPAEVYVEPEKLIDPTLTPCENFTVSVNIINATNLYAFEFKLDYDSSLIEAIEIQEGPFLQSVGPTSILKEEISNSEGYVWFTVTLLSLPSANGNGTLATITFHVISEGATLLTLYDIRLSNEVSEPLPHTTKNGYFANVVFAKLFVDPPEIIDPTILPGDIFSIDIKIANIQDLYGYEFQLNYNKAVLTCIGVIIHAILNETNFTNKFSVDDGTGEVFVNVTYYPPANPISTIEPLSLATLIFKVDRIGISNLTLFPTELIDPHGDQIPHETEHGFFQSVIRDVAVLYVAPSKTSVYEEWTVNITVIVKNEGDLPETFNVTAYYNNNPIGTIRVSNLAPGENYTVIFEWSVMGLDPKIDYLIKAEAESVPYEMDLADNIYIDGIVRIRLMGDVNGDGKVDILDLIAVAAAFGSTPSSPNWNPDADLDQNGIVNILDLIILAINYGRTL